MEEFGGIGQGKRRRTSLSACSAHCCAARDAAPIFVISAMASTCGRMWIFQPRFSGFARSSPPQCTGRVAGASASRWWHSRTARKQAPRLAACSIEPKKRIAAVIQRQVFLQARCPRATYCVQCCCLAIFIPAQLPHSYGYTRRVDSLWLLMRALGYSRERIAPRVGKRLWWAQPRTSAIQTQQSRFEFEGSRWDSAQRQPFASNGTCPP